jgi:UDP-glucose 4-epimerase
VLITGGAGYIGHIVYAILESLKCEVWVLDIVPSTHSFQRQERIFKCSILDTERLDEIFRNYSFDVVVHLASFIQVSESVANPEMYHLNNVVGTERLIQSMSNYCSKLIFASSAAVYGNLNKHATESTQCNPSSPYGEGKLTCEQLLEDSNLSCIILRLFNVAGSVVHPRLNEVILGEDHTPETHLIPLVIQRHIRKEVVNIFGNNHSTPDGTCIREYVHVHDVANAIIMSIQYLMTNQNVHQTFNVSSGKGYSVQEVITTLSKIGVEYGLESIVPEIEPARTGDPATITAELSAIKTVLKWEPQYSNLNELLRSCWLHHLN